MEDPIVGGSQEFDAWLSSARARAAAANAFDASLQDILIANLAVTEWKPLIGGVQRVNAVCCLEREPTDMNDHEALLAKHRGVAQTVNVALAAAGPWPRFRIATVR